MFVDNGFTDGNIQKVISRIATIIIAGGKKVDIIPTVDQLSESCRSTFRGTSLCVAAAVFHSSPNEGQSGKWNYSIRADASLGWKIDTTATDNDAEIFILPFQHAIHSAIISLNETSSIRRLPGEVRGIIPFDPARRIFVLEFTVQFAFSY